MEVQCRDTTQTFLLQVVGNLGDPPPPTRAVTFWKEKRRFDVAFTVFATNYGSTTLFMNHNRLDFPLFFHKYMYIP